MAGRPAVELNVETEAFRQVAAAMRREEDGKQLRKELIANFKTAVQPGVSAVQGKLRSIPRSSSVAQSPALGSYLASRVKAQVSLTGRRAGVRIRIAQTPNLRGFKMAARRLNRQSWRHPVYGKAEVWVTQNSPMPGYFDDTLAAGRARYREAVLDALAAMARRLIRRSKS